MDLVKSLPVEVITHLPDGYEIEPGVWLVLPEHDNIRDGLIRTNDWIKNEDWYPKALLDVAWYGDDGAGNVIGWRPTSAESLLWNPEDGDSPWKSAPSRRFGISF